MRKEIQFHLRGMAPVGGGRTRWEWRRRLGEAGRVVRLSDPPSPTATFEVSLVFHLVAHRLVRADVDRLATPVLDTLFASRHVQADPTLTGILFPAVEDAAIVRLEACKVEADGPEGEGVDVRVIWSDPGAKPASDRASRSIRRSGPGRGSARRRS
jgi:hypothetical protein